MKKLVIFLVFVFNASVAMSETDYLKTNMAGRVLEGTLIGARCPEANSELQIVEKSGNKTWLSCRINDPICEVSCSSSSKAKKLLKQNAGKLFKISIAESQEFPHGYVHFIKKIVIE